MEKKQKQKQPSIKLIIFIKKIDLKSFHIMLKKKSRHNPEVKVRWKSETYIIMNSKMHCKKDLNI